MSGDESTQKETKGPFGSRTKRGWSIIARHLDCSEYDNCLDIADSKRWKVFTCADCELACEAIDLTYISVRSNEIID